MDNNLYKLLPKVDDILAMEDIKELQNNIPYSIILESIREELDVLRNRIKELDEQGLLNELSMLKDRIVRLANKKNRYKLRTVVNGTGIVIHTNLGRSLINEEVIENMRIVSTKYSNLEYDLEKGMRGSRYSHLEEVVANVVGGEAALVVNNNAAAVLLTLSTVARGKEVIVSRGELIEIGGAFRVPEVMEQSGAILREVGTTNKTHLRDYENSINDMTGALLKVHTSNYRILGFTSNVEIDELAILKEKYNIPVIEDLGSGVLIDLSKYGISYEPTVSQSLKKGADIVTFSGDKLLGGPQAGIIVGKREWIEKMKKNPLTRAFRVDKFTIAALEATLRYYLDENDAISKIPTLRMLTVKLEELKLRAEKLASDMAVYGEYIDINVEESYSEVGGGSLPLEKLKTYCVTLKPKDDNLVRLERLLRENDTPIIVRVFKEKIYIDVRTLLNGDHLTIIDGLKNALRYEV